VHNPICRSRRLRTVAIALVVSAAVALLPGCSSSKSAAPRGSPSPSERPLTKEEYVNQAAVLCSVSQGSRGPDPSTAADYVAVIQSQIADLKALQAKLESLVPPAADKAKLRDQFLTPKARTIKVFEDAMPDVQKVAATGDLAATRLAFQPAAQQSVDLAKQAQPFLTSYGLDACA
jgi:hypothetical protein